MAIIETTASLVPPRWCFHWWASGQTPRPKPSPFYSAQRCNFIKQTNKQTQKQDSMSEMTNWTWTANIPLGERGYRLCSLHHVMCSLTWQVYFQDYCSEFLGQSPPFLFIFLEHQLSPHPLNLSARDVNDLMEGPLKISTKPPDNHTGCPRGREKRFTSWCFPYAGERRIAGSQNALASSQRRLQ